MRGARPTGRTSEQNAFSAPLGQIRIPLLPIPIALSVWSLGITGRLACRSRDAACCPGSKPGQRMGGIEITKTFDGVLLVLMDESSMPGQFTKQTVLAQLLHSPSLDRYHATSAARGGCRVQIDWATGLARRTLAIWMVCGVENHIRKPAFEVRIVTELFKQFRVVAQEFEHNAVQRFVML